MTIVGLCGFGAIAKPVARFLVSPGVDGLTLGSVACRQLQLVKLQLCETANHVYITKNILEVVDRSDIVIECLPPELFEDVAVPTIEAGKTLLALSCGTLLSRPELIDRARATGARIAVPSGALVGIDGVMAAAHGDRCSVTLKTRKPPAGLLGAPYLKEQNINLDHLSEPLRVFQGNALEAARGFPANVNIAAALSLAGIGAERTQVEIWADPAVSRNTHSIQVDSDAARFTVSIEGVPSSENPRTGKLTGNSVIAWLKKYANSTLRIGT